MLSVLSVTRKPILDKDEEPCIGGELFIYYKPTLDQGEEPCNGGELFIY